MTFSMHCVPLCSDMDNTDICFVTIEFIMNSVQYFSEILVRIWTRRKYFRIRVTLQSKCWEAVQLKPWVTKQLKFKWGALYSYSQHNSIPVSQFENSARISWSFTKTTKRLSTGSRSLIENYCESSYRTRGKRRGFRFRVLICRIAAKRLDNILLGRIPAHVG